MLWLLLLSCSDPPEAAHATLVLDGLVAKLPIVRSDKRDAAVAHSASQTFRLPQMVPHADLVLEGLWWSATVTVNGHALAPVTGGYAPVSLPIVDWLVAGENTITLAVTPPGEVVPSLQSGELRTFSPLAAAPKLVMHGESWVASAGLVTTAEGVGAVAYVRDAPAGAFVWFKVWRDGVLVADLQDARVVDGVARTAPKAWTEPTWDVGAGEASLAWVEARLATLAGELDTASFRSAARRVSVGAGGTEIGAQPRQLAGLRWSGGPVETDLGWLARTGLNTVELHGQAISEALLDAADEAGAAVVIVPRCDGRIRAGGGTRKPIGDANPDAWAQPLLDEQDQRALVALLNHPSAVLWVMEADQSQRATRVAALAADPVQRPIAGRDLPLLHGVPEPRGWQIEYTAEVRDPEHQLGLALAGGASGGILPGPPGQAGEGWIQTVRNELGAANLTPPQARTGSGGVQVTGLKPGDVVWLQAEGTARVGAIAAADGTARLSLWHTGEAKLTLPSGSQTVKLERGRVVTATEQF